MPYQAAKPFAEPRRVRRCDITGGKTAANCQCSFELIHYKRSAYQAANPLSSAYIACCRTIRYYCVAVVCVQLAYQAANGASGCRDSYIQVTVDTVYRYVFGPANQRT